MAVDHAPYGIGVNCVAPGTMFTPMVNRDGGGSDAAREHCREASLLAVEVEGTGWDIGNAVVFLGADWARYITGQTLVVDGGCTPTARPGLGIELRRHRQMKHCPAHAIASSCAARWKAYQ